METTDIINELRAEIAALSGRIDQLEKQLLDTQALAAKPQDDDPKQQAEQLQQQQIEGLQEPQAEEPQEHTEPQQEQAEPQAEEPQQQTERLQEQEQQQSEQQAEEPEIALDLDIEIDNQGRSQLPDLHSFQWMNDMPGGEVANMISGISLNDRVLFINTLFREDPSLFQSTISALNGMKSLEDAIAWLVARFPEWNLNSEVVYRFMMAARRKLR